MSGYFDEKESYVEPELNFKPIPSEELESEVVKQKDAFNNLLKTLDSSLDKKKILWKQIYDYALTDRTNAYLVFADLYKNVFNNADKHAIHGQTLSKNMERMSKATDQLLKLAELVAAAEEKTTSTNEEPINDDDIYSSIQKKKTH
jgi:hypothetical protein